jgi:hypothetical protein
MVICSLSRGSKTSRNNDHFIHDMNDYDLDPIQETPIAEQGGDPLSGKPHQKFTPEEDDQLRVAVEQFGDLNWKIIARHLPNRTPRQCKERWTNYLQPQINTSQWTRSEDARLLEKYNEFGSKWMRIAKFFINRTDAMVKNRFLVLKRRGMRAAGIPPPPRSRKQRIESALETMVETTTSDLPAFTEFWEQSAELEACAGYDDYFLDF